MKDSTNENFNELYQQYTEDPFCLQLLRLDGVSPDKLNIAGMTHEYFNKRVADMSIDANANANENISPTNYQSEVTKGILKLDGERILYAQLETLYGITEAKRLLCRIWDKDLYFHDASAHGIQTIYCLAFSTTPIMMNGRQYGQLKSLTPKRADSFMAQAIETIMDISNTVMGAVAPADILVNYSYYVKKEYIELCKILRSEAVRFANSGDCDGYIFWDLIRLKYNIKLEEMRDVFEKTDIEETARYIMKKNISNDLQKLVHIVNNKYRVSGQSPFVNIALYCRNTLKNLFDLTRFPDGSSVDYEFVMFVQKIFGEFIAKGDPDTGLPYRFPVMTVNINKSENMDNDFKKWVSRTNCKTGVFNIYPSKGNKIAMCCRFQNDITQMREYRADTFGNGGLNIGSSRVITINLPRIALKADGDWYVFTNELMSIMDDIKKLHVAHRRIINTRIEQGFIQFFKPLNWLTIDHMFATVGIHGVFEANYFMRLDIDSPDGIAFTKQMLKMIDDMTLEYTKETKIVFNVEEIPGESASVVLAACDKLMFPKRQIFELYSNQYIPLISEIDIFSKIKLSGEFMNILSGGGIAHFNISERIEDPAIMEKLIDIAMEYNVPHFAINYGFGICEDGHTSVVGTGKICPLCNESIVKWITRIIGYFVEIDTWNAVRKNYEFPLRKFTKLDLKNGVNNEKI
jgi:ribonucleoside-triphosphate reductase